jgi:hypothetical protein
MPPERVNKGEILTNYCDVPSLYGKALVDLRTVVSALPKLDPADKWVVRNHLNITDDTR